MAQQEDSTMDVKQVAEYVGCSTSMVRKLIRIKGIPFYKVGNRFIFKRSIIDWWISNKLKKEGFNYGHKYQ